MKCIVLVAFVIASFIVVVRSDATAYYAPEYEYVPVEEVGAVRGKRHVSPALPFLAGVAAGGVLGPILYNRLYGWKPVTVDHGWIAPQPQGWH